MEPRDITAVQKLHDEQNRKHGTSYPLTMPFDESWRKRWQVPLALTILDGDEVKQGVTFENTGVEMMLAGCNPRATAHLHQEIQAAFYLLRSMGYEVVHTFIPKDVVLPVERPLKDVGFVRDDGKFAHFIKDLTADDPKEES